MPDLSFLLAALAVFLSHAVPSWPGLREVLRAKLGRAGFGALHGLGSTAALTWLIFAYRAQESREMLFVPPDWAPMPVLALTPVAFVLIALRLACPPGELTAPEPPAGIYRLTRAPGALGTLLWALLHLQATGDGPRVVLFGLFALIAGFSLVKNHYALTRSNAPAARAFLKETALLPGWALLRRRTRFVAAEWRAARPMLGLIAGLTAWGAMLALHPALFGVDPLALAGF